MRIVQVVNGLGWVGGVQEYVAGLSKGLSEQGHEVVILTAGKPPPEGPAPHRLTDGLDVRFHPKRRVVKRYLYPTGMRASLRDLSRWADVVHTHQPFFVGTWLSAATRIPVAATLHLHPEHVERSPRHRAQLRVLLRRLDLVAGVSRAELDLITTVAEPKNSGVVWPALEDLPERSAGKRRLVAYVGRLTWSKNLETLIRALAVLPADLDKAVVGGGPDAAQIRALCVQLGMSPHVVVSEEVSDEQIDATLSAAQVFVSISQQEAFGIAPMRALAHGCRTVLSDIPSHREIVTTLGAGEENLVDPHVDPLRLASAIKSALERPPLPAEVAARVPTWRDSAASALELYERILTDRRGRGQRRPESWRASR